MALKIRMIGRWGDYRIGDILQPPGGLRKILLDRKLAELVTPVIPGESGTRLDNTAFKAPSPSKPKGKKRK